MKKERLDVLLVARGFATSREKAKALIMSGKVLVNNEREEKAGTMISVEKEIRIKGEPERFVSRGGYKLLKAMSSFDINLKDKVCMDIGASTGGFTDCMLQHGAKRVYSIDVGYGQLDWRLRNDERVIVLEKTNVRYLDDEQVPEFADFASIDVSFISLTKIIDAVQGRLKENAEVVCLIKPQFEAGRENVGKNGVVRDPKTHIQVIEFIVEEMKNRNFQVLDLDFSPIKGPAGNIEFLIYLRNVKKKYETNNQQNQENEMVGCERVIKSEIDINDVVRRSHEMVE